MHAYHVAALLLAASTWAATAEAAPRRSRPKTPAPAPASSATVSADAATSAAPELGFRIEARTREAGGNLVVLPGPRIVASLHQFYNPAARVAALTPASSAEPQFAPWLPAPWNSGAATTSTAALDSVLGLAATRDGRTVWLLDNGLRSGQCPKLLECDAAGPGSVRRVVYLPAPATEKDSFVNDLVLDERRGKIYIADPAGGANAAVLVVDMGSGLARRVLRGDRSVRPEKSAELVIDGRPVQVRLPDGKIITPRVGVNPIALDARAEWLYLGPMHGTTMYRVRAEDLANDALPADALGRRVYEYAKKPICDGITIDAADNIYLGEIAANAIGVLPAGGKPYRRLAEGPALSWADAFAAQGDAAQPGQRIYGIANQLHRSARLNANKPESRPPYTVFSFLAVK